MKKEKRIKRRESSPDVSSGRREGNRAPTEGWSPSRDKKRGFVLITVVVLLTILVFLGLFLVTLMMPELKIAQSQKGATQAFYIAEAGIEEAIWKIQYDADFKQNFEQGTFDSTNGSFSRSPALSNSASYEVLIESLDQGKAQITSKGFFEIDQRKAKRVVKIKALKPQNPEPFLNKASYGLEDIEFFGSQVNITKGNLFAGDDIWVWGLSTVNVAENVEAVDQIEVWPLSNLNVQGEMHSANYPPAPSPILMPQVDFDSESPDSFLNRATAIYTEREFKNLLKDNPNLTLEGIIYVKGNIDIKKGRHLTVNGLLAADGSISVGLTSLSPPTGTASLNINVPASLGPSGVLSKNKIKIGVHASDMTINGLMYACDHIYIFGFDAYLTVLGGLIAREVEIMSILKPVTIEYNNEIVTKILGTSAPTVEIEHWEEVY